MTRVLANTASLVVEILALGLHGSEHATGGAGLAAAGVSAVLILPALYRLSGRLLAPEESSV